MNKYVLSCGLALLILTSAMGLKAAVSYQPFPTPRPGGGYQPFPTPRPGGLSQLVPTPDSGR